VNLYLTEAIAYYNLGASYEHLGESQLDASIKSYEIANSIAKLYLPRNHPLGKKIDDSLAQVNQRVHKINQMHLQRSNIRN